MSTSSETPDNSPSVESGEEGEVLNSSLLTKYAPIAVIGGMLYVWGVGATLVFGAILLMILLHELGHFACAKLFGMKVTEFFVGFGPVVWSTQRGETEYGIKALPLGGYVRIIGMNNLDPVESGDEARTYMSKPYWQRMCTILAGSGVHFILAFLLVFTVLAGTGLPDPEKPTSTVESVDAVFEGASPAAEAGMKAGDTIVAVAGTPVNTWSEIPDYTQEHHGEEIEFTVERDGKIINLMVEPAPARILGGPNDGQVVGFVGIRPTYETSRLGVGSAFVRSGQTLWDVGTGSAKSLISFFTPAGMSSYTSEFAVPPAEPTPVDNGDDIPVIQQGEAMEAPESGVRFLSPVGFLQVADGASNSWTDTLLLLFLVNAFVGVFNLVPLLPFDGGHAAVATYEKLRSLMAGRRHQADVSKLMPMTYAVVLVLAFIAVSSLYLDIVNPVVSPYN